MIFNKSKISLISILSVGAIASIILIIHMSTPEYRVKRTVINYYNARNRNCHYKNQETFNDVLNYSYPGPNYRSGRIFGSGCLINSVTGEEIVKIGLISINKDEALANVYIHYTQTDNKFYEEDNEILEHVFLKQQDGDWKIWDVQYQ